MGAAVDNRAANRRLVIFLAMVAPFIALLLGQLVRLTVILPAREETEAISFAEVDRGPILDRKGRILAVSVRQQTLTAWVPYVKNPEETARLLAPIVGLSSEVILSNLRDHSGFARIKRRISEEQAEAVLRLQAEKKLAGIQVENEFGRSYPGGRLGSHLVGYVGVDNIGLDGIEYTFNESLYPPVVGTETETVYGNQVFLTIDLTVQNAVEKAAREAMQATKSDSLMILVMEAGTGEILGYSALPDFDPNEFQDESPRIDRNSLMDRPAVWAYEPGSVMKVFTLSAFLQVGALSPGSRFTCGGAYEAQARDGSRIKIGCIRSHGTVSPQQIIQYSCNAGAGYASDGASKDDFYQMLTRFGFGKATGVPLLGETAGMLAKTARWSDRSKPTIAIGQEISVSAMQIMAAATALANGGVLLKPQVVKKIVSPDGRVVKEYGREPLWEAISPQTARQMLEWMETATTREGTAYRAAISGVRIAGKTGTAQVTNRATKKYSANDFIASFLGIFPVDDPRLIVYVAIENPKGESYYGSTVAAPVFKKVAEQLILALGIPHEGEDTLTHSGEVSVQIPAGPVVESTMPDLKGTPKKLLLPLTLREDLAVTIRGDGYVVRQTPPPGTPVTRDMKILLELE